jgi:hypothetical protein
MLKPSSHYREEAWAVLINSVFQKFISHIDNPFIFEGLPVTKNVRQ